MGKRLGIIFIAVVVVAVVTIAVTSLSLGNNQQPADTGTSTTSPAATTHVIASNEVRNANPDDFLPGPSTTP